jgi:transposase-like protein
VARPSKKTPDRERLIVEALRAGATRRAAALHAGINEATLYRWLSNASFASLIARVEADVEIRLTALIIHAAADDPRHAEWWLERRRSDEYSRRDRLELSVRQHAEKLAAEMGIDAAELIAEAERIVSGS